MNLTNQVTSLETSKKLKELGVEHEGLYQYCGGHLYYIEDEDTHEEIEKFEECEGDEILEDDEYCHSAMMTCEYFIPAFTASELAEMLPAGIDTRSGETHYLTINRMDGKQWDVGYECTGYVYDIPTTKNDSLVEALAACLIHLKENKTI